MQKLLYSKNIDFSLRDWKCESLRKVFAGTDCIMALTTDGRVLQKVKDPAVAARTEYWTRIEDIAISNVCPGVAIGLVSDGTCMIAKRPLRKLTEGSLWKFEQVNDAVRAWKNIVAVAVSDAFFALDAEGYVHCAPFCGALYPEIHGWKNIVRIVAGLQGVVFGISADGRVYAAGETRHLPSVSGLRDVVDLGVSGAESTKIYAVHRDGTIEHMNHGLLDVRCSLAPGSIRSHPVGIAIREPDGSLWFDTYCYAGVVPEKVFGSQPIDSFALGDTDYGPTFLLALQEE